jgi:hypothetical protein
MKYTHPSHLVDLIDLPLKEFVERAHPLNKEQINSPSSVLENNPKMANITVRDCRKWFDGSYDYDMKKSRPEFKEYKEWLNLAIQIFEHEDPSSHQKWQEEICSLRDFLDKVNQLVGIFSDITCPFSEATGLGKKELIKQLPSAHFCKRYNILLREVIKLFDHIGDSIDDVMWPPELPGVDKLKDEQKVINTNYIEIHTYCSQVESLLRGLRLEIEKAIDMRSI